MATALPRVTVEFLGVLRQRAGCTEQTIAAGTVAELIRAVEEAYPALGQLTTAEGQLAKKYLLSINGERFSDDPRRQLHSGDHVILLSADAGG